MKLAQTDLDSGIAVEGQAMSGLPSRLETLTKKQFRTIPQAVAALANMERELDSAESYAQIRKLADAAEALKILFRHVAEGEKQSRACRARRERAHRGRNQADTEGGK